MSKRHAVYAVIALAACSAGLGCRSGEKRRARLEFSCNAVRSSIKLVEDNLPAREMYSMRAAADQLLRALDGLPKKVEKKATTRVQERKAVAEKARDFFAKLRPTLESLKYDEGEVRAKLRELSGMIDEVERG